MTEVAGRQAEFEQAVSQLSERSREVEQRTAQRLRAGADKLRKEMTEQGTQLRTDTNEALRAQREGLQRAIDTERQDRRRALAEVNSKVNALHDDQVIAATLAGEYLADAEKLREQVLAFPHQRYLPGRLDALDSRLATTQSNVDNGVAAYGLSGVQELSQQFGELRLELEQLDREWRTCRIAAERELVRIKVLLDQNATLDLKVRLGADPRQPAPNVDHWSRGALSRLGVEVATLLAQVRDEENPLTTESLVRIVTTVAPEFEQRLESVVGQAVTAMQASQLRTNLADLIADALDAHHRYEVTEFGFAGDDERQTFLAKTVHYVSGSEIVIEVEPGNAPELPPVMRLHNFDADDASEGERSARTRSIRDSVLEHSGIDLRTMEEAGQPAENMRDVGRIRREGMETTTEQARATGAGGATSPP
jgi:hypothetical protein